MAEDKKDYGYDMNDDFVDELFKRVFEAQKRGVSNQALLNLIDQLPPLGKKEPARAE